MSRYIHFVLRRPLTILIMLVILTAALVPGITMLKFDNSVESFMPKDDSEYIYYTRLKEIYGDNGRFVIMAVSGNDLWHIETFQKLDTLLADLEEYKDFDEDRENSRLKKFDSIISQKTVRYDDLMAAFRDDPGFQRLLERKTGRISGKRGILSRGGLKKLRKQILHSIDFKRKKVVDSIISPLTSADITGENDTLETYDLIEKDDDGRRILPSSGKEIGEFRQRLERNPSFEKGLYCRDPQTGEITDFCVVIKFINLDDQDPVVREMMEVIDHHRDDLTIVSSGVPVVNMWMNDYMHADLFRNIPLVLLVVVIVFYFNFRSVRGVLLPFVTLGLAELWILGLMGYIGYRITPVGVSIPPLMIAVGSSYAIHLLNQYYSDFSKIIKMDKKTGLYESMSHISLTVLLAGLTTFVAFMSLASSQVSAVREWGIASAIGVMFAVFISCSLIPACLVLLPNTIPSVLSRKKNAETMVDKIITLMAKGSIVHYRKVLIVVGILIAVSVTGIFRINIETAFLNYFRENDQVRVDTRNVGGKFGGGWCYDILIDSGKTDGVKDPEFLVTIENLRKWLVSDKNPDLNIGRTESFSDFIKTMHMAMNNDDISFYKIPETRADIIDYLEIYSGDDDNSDGRFDEFEPFVDIDFRMCNLLARLCEKEDYNVGTTKIKIIAGKIADYLDKNLPEGISYNISGFPMMNVKLVHYIVLGQMQSLLLSLLVVGLIVALLFQQIKAGPLALIPMSIAVIVNFGIMGWLQIDLDMATSVIAAITIGIGVDDTIHFLNTFRQNRAQGLDIDETIRRTLTVSGKAILFTSIALIFGFSVLITSNFLPITLFGILSAATMINTTIGALLILPSVIKATGINLDRPPSDSWVSRHLNIDKFLGMEQND